MAKVSYKRVETNDLVDGVPILDGQLIYSKQGKTYMDYGTDRVAINGTTDTEMSDNSTNPVENSVIKNYVDTQISTVSNNIHNGFILWQNSDPTVPISSDLVISLNSSDYDVYEVFYAHNTTNTTYLSMKSIKGYGILLITLLGTNPYRRVVEYVSDTSLKIRAQEQSQNDLAIPLYIIGYKTELFE